MLETSIKKLQNNLLKTSEITQELINLANKSRKLEQEGE